jgi:hypothetical protein
MVLVVTTISLDGYHLYMGLHRIYHGSAGAMWSRLSWHRRSGQLLVWTFFGWSIKWLDVMAEHYL